MSVHDSHFSSAYPAIKNIRNALISGLLVTCALIILMSIISLNELRSLSQSLDELVKASYVKTGLLYDMRISARERNLRLMMTLLVEDEFLVDEEWIKFREQGTAFLQAREKYIALELDQDEMKMLDEQRDISINAVAVQYDIYENVIAGNRQQALELIELALEYQTQVFDIVDRMLELQKKKNDKIVEQSRLSKQAASRTVTLLSVVVVVLIFVSSLYILRRISQQAWHIENEGMKFKALIEGSMDSVLVLENNQIIDANENALAMFSVNNIEDLGDIDSDFVNRFRIDEKESHSIPISEAIKQAKVGVKKRYHWFFSNIYDVEISVDVEITAIDLRGKELIQVVIRDVTEREVFQKTLKELNEGLEIKVNERTEELKDLNSKIATVARSAGMAEVASGVLHNVGNVLNSINVSTSVLKEKIRNSKVLSLSKVSDLLNENKSDLCNFIENDEKGKFIIPYIEKLASQIEVDQKNQIKELDCLGDNIDHIKTIISMQQAYAGGMGIVETILASQLFDDAVKINISSLNNNRVTLTYEYEVNEELTVDKHKVIQVLVNFISNAKYALMNNDVDNRNIVLGIKQYGKDLEFSVKDNGVGIDDETMTRLFEFGYKKRKGGHGYGLHHSALMAKELNGDIKVHSEGKGKGAMFSLILPVKPEDNK